MKIFLIIITVLLSYQTIAIAGPQQNPNGYIPAGSGRIQPADERIRPNYTPLRDYRAQPIQPSGESRTNQQQGGMRNSRDPRFMPPGWIDTSGGGNSRQ